AIEPGGEDGGVPGADCDGRQFLMRYEQCLITCGETELIDADVERGLVEPGDEAAGHPELDALFQCLRLPAQLLEQLASQAILRRFSGFASSAETGESAGSEPRMIRPAFQEQAPFSIDQDGANVFWPSDHDTRPSVVDPSLPVTVPAQRRA